MKVSHLPGNRRIDYAVRIVIFSHDGTNLVKFTRKFALRAKHQSQTHKKVSETDFLLFWTIKNYSTIQYNCLFVSLNSIKMQNRIDDSLQFKICSVPHITHQI